MQRAVWRGLQLVSALLALCAILLVLSSPESWAPETLCSYLHLCRLAENDLGTLLSRQQTQERRSPLVVRVAIPSVADEFPVRDFLRQTLRNSGLFPPGELSFQLRFFVARQPPSRFSVLWQADTATVNRRVLEEQGQNGDMEIVDGLEGDESADMKRKKAQKWVSRFTQNEDEYSFILDAASLTRLLALGRRTRHLLPRVLDPRHPSGALYDPQRGEEAFDASGPAISRD